MKKFIFLMVIALAIATHARAEQSGNEYSDEVFEANLDYYKCLIAESYVAITRNDISELYEKGEPRATVEIMRTALNKCQHSSDDLVRIGGDSGERLRKEAYHAAFDVIEQKVKINFQIRYDKEVGPHVRDYEGCMHSAAQSYCPSNATPFEIAEAASGKCATQFHNAVNAERRFLDSRNANVALAEKSMNNFKEKIKEKVVQQVVECRMQQNLKPLPKVE